MKKIVRLLTILVAILMLVTTATNKSVDAASNTVKTVGVPITSDNAVRLKLTTDNAKTPLSDYSNYIEMAVGDSNTYTTTYPLGLDYFNKDITVVVEATLVNNVDMPSDGSNRIYLNSGGLVSVEWMKSVNVQIDYKISLFDEDGKPFSAQTLLLGFADPDESNYLFKTAGRDFYYIDAVLTDTAVDAPPTAANAYLVEDDGLFLIDSSGDKVDPKSGINPPSYNDAFFFVSMNGESTFEFSTVTFKYGGISIPMFYSLYKDWNVTYDLQDNPATPAINPNIDPENPDDPEKSFIKYTSGINFEREIEDPSRDGYKFLGWAREDIEDPESESNHKIQKWDLGDKHFIASWEALPQNYVVEYYYMDDEGNYSETPTDSEIRESVTDATVTVTNEDKTPTKEGYVLDNTAEGLVYEAVVAADGSTVLKVYFKKAYTVIYDSGDHSQDENVTNDGLDYGVDTPAEPTFTPDAGYEFDGWDIEIVPTVTENATYVAQWKPIIYPVKYVLNDDETHPAYNPSENPSEYTIEDEYDILEPTRAGYKFLGWEEGDRIELGSTGEKVFTARWEKIIYPVEYVMNGGDNHPDNPTEYTIDDYYKIKNPARPGYNFVGWAEGDEIPVGSTGKKVFTAIWEKIAKPAPIVVPSTGVDYR